MFNGPFSGSFLHCTLKCATSNYIYFGIIIISIFKTNSVQMLVFLEKKSNLTLFYTIYVWYKQDNVFFGTFFFDFAICKKDIRKFLRFFS